MDMMLQFPPSPNTGEIFPTERPTWRWDGEKWASIISGGEDFDDAPAGALYGRKDHSWQQMLPITGGQLHGNLIVNGDINLGTPIIRFGADPANRFLYWTGTDYVLGGSGNVYTTGNFNPATKLTTDGNVYQLRYDNAGRMIWHQAYVGDRTLANYGDVSALYDWVNANFVTAGAVNNFMNSINLAYAADFNGGLVYLSGNLYDAYSGAIITMIGAGAGGSGQYQGGGPTSLGISARARWLQYHIPNAGWITAGVA
jgi:YD repeat-containing protein